MNATAVIAPGQMAYVYIPADELRSFVDGIFPKLAKCPVADVTRGPWHRYTAGHDVLLDVPKTFSESGTLEGAKHAGHVILTDFPTKAGIPIPGFSESGLGHLLEQAGIHRGWLQLNLCEAGLGIIAVAEGTPDLIQAINGTMLMHCSTFFDTFIEGGIEVGLSMATKNPILLAGGIENIAAGLIATWNTYVVHIDPFLFFGSAATSALIGFTVASGLVHMTLGDATIAGLRSGIVGALFTVSPAFGFGALAGFVTYKLGEKLASIHNSSVKALLSIDNNAYNLLLDELCRGNANIRDFLDNATPQVIFTDQADTLSSDTEVFSTDIHPFSTQADTLSSEPEVFSTYIQPLPTDSVCLEDSYCFVFPDSQNK